MRYYIIDTFALLFCRPPCCGCDLSCSKCGETLPKDDSRKHSNESAVKQAAAKWGREVVVKKKVLKLVRVKFPNAHALIIMAAV